MLLPSPRTSDTNGAGHHSDGGMDLRTAVAEIPLLPTPNQPGTAGDLTLPSAVNLLPTPMVGSNHPSSHGQISGQYRDQMRQAFANWGEYGPAIRRWEAITRPAPEPTKVNAKGNPKLSDEFDEWLMGLPAGWITDVPGITWNEALKACGNGVVPQQAVAALLHLWAMSEVAA